MACLRIALTPGEPAGIGPDLTVQMAGQPRHHEIVAIADPALLRQRAQLLGLPLTLRIHNPTAKPRPDQAGELCVQPVSLACPCQPGRLNPANADYVLQTLGQASDACCRGDFAAMVTGPVQKSVINEAGIPFSGHTEFLAQRTGADGVVMLLACAAMRVALVTTHLPLAQVPTALSADRLREVLEILHRELRRRFGCDNPRIAVLGLNPHAGEAGHLGREEIEIIEPVLEQMRRQGMNLRGPLPADTAFKPEFLDSSDAVLAMYHDQGLPVLKYAGFGAAVNITLGLPIIRTSVDHGTALELAGSAKADAGSLHYALHCAQALAQGKAP